jgi:hypothetical protein
VLALGAPWYLWALPDQVAYVEAFFFGLDPAGAVPSWRTPLTLRTWLVWLGYDVLTVFGLEPSTVRAAVALPIAVVVLAPILAAVRRAPEPLRRLAVLGAVQFAAAFLAQSVYALHFGHTAVLSWSYFVVWTSPLLLGWGLAGMTGGRAARLAVAALAAWTVGHALFLRPEPGRYEESLDHRRWIAARLDREAGKPTAIVHRSDNEAKLMSLYYDGPLGQTVCADACAHGFPDGVDTVLVIARADAADLVMGDGWAEERRERFGGSLVLTYRRPGPRLSSAALCGSLGPHGC